MEAALRVGVLIQRAAVEMGEAVRIDREMGGNPIEDDPETRRMGFVDEAGKTSGIPKAGGGGEEADRLVPPGGVERVFAHRKQFQVGETKIGGIGDECVGEFVVAEEAAVWVAAPGAEVDFVRRHRGAARIVRAWGFGGECQRVGTGDDRGG